MPYHSAYKLPFDALDLVVVDDSQAMRQILHSVLISFGVRRLRLFACGQSALDEMRNDPPNMLITDWRMKPMDGYQLLQSIRKSDMMPLSLLPVLMLTGYASRQFVQNCFNAGVQQFLVKPISPKAIYDRIQWTLNDSRYLICRKGSYGLETYTTVTAPDAEADIDYLDMPAGESESEEQRLAVNDHWQI